MADYSNKYGIHKGSMVAINFNPLSNFTRPDYVTTRYNKTIHRVSKVVNYGGWGTYFELEDVVSRKGVPYGFTIDELRKVEK